jgi:hypothetical protein
LTTSKDWLEEGENNIINKCENDFDNNSNNNDHDQESKSINQDDNNKDENEKTVQAKSKIKTENRLYYQGLEGHQNHLQNYHTINSLSNTRTSNKKVFCQHSKNNCSSHQQNESKSDKGIDLPKLIVS